VRPVSTPGPCTRKRGVDYILTVRRPRNVQAKRVVILCVDLLRRVDVHLHLSDLRIEERKTNGAIAHNVHPKRPLRWCNWAASRSRTGRFHDSRARGCTTPRGAPGAPGGCAPCRNGNGAERAPTWHPRPVFWRDLKYLTAVCSLVYTYSYQVPPAGCFFCFLHENMAKCVKPPTNTRRASRRDSSTNLPYQHARRPL
jgi:hypothetical protein